MKIRPNLRVDFTINLSLSEGEARALDALVGYGADGFLDVFYKHMGRSYLEPYESDLRRLFAEISGQVVPLIHEVDGIKREAENVMRKKRGAHA